MSEYPVITPPKPLRALVDALKTDRGRVPGAASQALLGMFDTIVWQKARIEPLEQALITAGVECPVRCFACHSVDIHFEDRSGQRRHTCNGCGYGWRLAFKR
jgi:hypothetical protein